MSKIETLRPSTIDLEAVKSQVQHNCDVSDALYAGHYSVCSLFLRLRDLYKWEKQLDPWIETASERLLAWIDETERKWENLSAKKIKDIIICGCSYPPFEVEKISDILEPLEFFYGGGYARSLKPTFFLGELEGKKEIEGIPVWMIGREYARDLFASPSMVQNDGIVYRRQAAMTFLWDQLFYIKKSGRRALNFALGAYGCQVKNTMKIRQEFNKIVADESLRYIYHEVGEIKDSVFDRDLWREIIAFYPHSPLELLARAVKDLLADTSREGTLRFIYGEKRKAALGFYVAFLNNLIKCIFPEIISAFDAFLNTEEWIHVEAAANEGYRTASRYARIISDIHTEGKLRKNPKWAQEEIKNQLLTPLGL